MKAKITLILIACAFSSVEGKLIQSGKLLNAKSKIELQNISKGVYFVNIFGENHKVSRRLLVNE